MPFCKIFVQGERKGFEVQNKKMGPTLVAIKMEIKQEGHDDFPAKKADADERRKVTRALRMVRKEVNSQRCNSLTQTLNKSLPVSLVVENYSERVKNNFDASISQEVSTDLGEQCFTFHTIF